MAPRPRGRPSRTIGPKTPPSRAGEAGAPRQEALKFAAEAGYRQGETVALTGLAQAQADLGDYDTAVTTAEQALDVARKTRLRLLEGHALVALASISLDRGQQADARAHAAAALAVHRETGHMLGQSRAERLLGLLGEAQAGSPLQESRAPATDVAPVDQWLAIDIDEALAERRRS